MSASVRWDGLDELTAWLRELPAELAGDAAGIVDGAARAARDEIAAAYPVRTGDLRKGLILRSITSDAVGRYGVGMVLINRAPHAYIFEHGTQARHSAIGARGAMPAGNVFIPRVLKHRRQMYAALVAMMRQHHLTVQQTYAPAA